MHRSNTTKWLILYVNDLPDERLTANTSVCLFADNANISTVFSDVSERPDMQVCLNEFVVWADRWQLQDLGVIVHDKCLFKQHVSSICRKAYSTINVIFSCFHKGILIICRPVLEYCSTVWNPNVPARHYLGVTEQLGITWA